jgi:pimeloyl-ACP methyl ester carboxylesterase
VTIAAPNLVNHKVSRSEYISIHGKQYHIRRWGNPDAPMLFMLHGWMDLSATYQFVVDALVQEWNVIAPDWGGFGLSEGQNGCYYLTQYLRDLDALLEHFTPTRPASILAHSMGANIATIFAGVRPERVAYLVNMEGLGPVPSLIKNTSDMMSDWLLAQRDPVAPPTYRSVEHFAERLVKANSQLPKSRALFLAEHFTRQREDGQFELLAESSVRAMLPLYPHRDQILEVWSRVTAKVFFARGTASFVSRAIDKYPGEMRARIDVLANCEEVVFDGVTHNMQHEVPEQIAAAVEKFLPR